MERGKVLMEFELLTEVEQATKLGSISVGGIFLRLEKWRPETGCLRERENNSEAWVRVVGLPVSLWEWDILRRIGEECGGFLAVDSQTENGGVIVGSTFGEAERQGTPQCSGGKRGKTVATGEEVGGEACTRASKRMEAKEGSRLEALLLPADGTQEPSRRSKVSEPTGLTPLSDLPNVNGPFNPGLSLWKSTERAKTLGLPARVGLDNRGPSPLVMVKAQVEEAHPALEETQSEGTSKTNCAMLEEVARGVLRPFWAILDITQGVTHRPCNGFGSIEEEGKCWELIEVNNDSMEESREALCLARSMPQEKEDGWKQAGRKVIWLGSGGEEEVYCARKRVPDYGSPMKIRLLSWNVRGANDNSKRKVIKAMIRSQKGVAGGILICWDKRTLEVLEMEMGQFSISCKLRNVEDGKAWIFIGVYGPFAKEDREILWEELGAIRGIWDDPWCLGAISMLPYPNGKGVIRGG
ncbi:hypothetical protein CK203_115576 [Vitis vinifera]|uniref:Uncharacterized protein n=1 Tax=Vitis vinifera TaxID=29760 RepID=A0A438FHR8_VITVI|nr:hypothetical protein CK203_115576 [Vitis vinifera]